MTYNVVTKLTVKIVKK